MTILSNERVPEPSEGDERLPGAEGWFRALAETTESAILVYRERLIYANPAAERLTGYLVRELVDQPIEILVPEEFMVAARDRIRRRLSGRASTEPYEIKIVRKDGVERWVEVRGSRLETIDGPAGLLSVLDITERKSTEIALRTHRARLELAQRVARIATWEWTLSSDELVFFGAAHEMIGCRAEELWRTGTAFLAAVVPEDHEAFVAEISRSISERNEFFAEFRLRSPSGRVLWISERGAALEGSEGGALRLIGVATDVTDAKKAEQALVEERERAQVTLASIGDGVIRTDAQGRIDYLNPIAERLTGWPASQALGRPVLEVFNVADENGRRIDFDPVEICLRENRVYELPGHFQLIRKDGVEFAVQDSVAPIRDSDGAIVGSVLVFKDVTRLRRMEREMAYLASHDPLTGLINRREFEGRLERSLESAREGERRHALLYLDLDEFKLVNDTAGHFAGDQLLKELSAVLQSCIRSTDTLARLGGDEFGVLLEDTAIERARRLAVALRAAVRRFRFSWQDRSFAVGVSIGLVPISIEMADRVGVLVAADAACYVAKESGRDRIHEYQADDVALVERYGAMLWVQRIQSALNEERFTLWCQPIEPLGRLLEPRGPRANDPPLAEIFVRLRGEDGELVLPGSFIPPAERYHLIGAIDRWVVRNAFATLARAQKEGYGAAMRYAINLSGQSIGDETFLGFVLTEIDSSGVKPETLLFEVTETAAVANLARAQGFIRTLKELGCGFVLDDFGSGLSSFAYLKNLDVDFLKIDGAFVRGATSGPTDRALIESIHQIGHLMGIQTIAEGVEDLSTLEFLRGIGMDYVQGNGLAPPVPLEEVLHSRRALVR